MLKTLLISVLNLAILSGCATIAGSPTQIVPISSEPRNATFTITDENGVEVISGNTPYTVSLEKGNGSYFGKKSYTLRLHQIGYNDEVIHLKAYPNGWYIGGNLILGGFALAPVGWLLIDPFSANMYTLLPDLRHRMDNNGTISFDFRLNGIPTRIVTDAPMQR